MAPVQPSIPIYKTNRKLKRRPGALSECVLLLNTAAPFAASLLSENQRQSTGNRHNIPKNQQVVSPCLQGFKLLFL
jgi:hypothetical protein